MFRLMTLNSSYTYVLFCTYVVCAFLQFKYRSLLIIIVRIIKPWDTVQFIYFYIWLHGLSLSCVPIPTINHVQILVRRSPVLIMPKYKQQLLKTLCLFIINICFQENPIAICQLLTHDEYLF